jgi:hypothetical protein
MIKAKLSEQSQVVRSTPRALSQARHILEINIQRKEQKSIFSREHLKKLGKHQQTSPRAIG